MSESTASSRWCVADSDLEDLTPTKARDLIVHCFCQAQGETFARAKRSLEVPCDDETVHRSIVAAVRLAFQEVGEDFQQADKGEPSEGGERPGKESLFLGHCR